jgi:chromosomal replication initiation ATPase DnaA
MSLIDPYTRGQFVRANSREWLIVATKPLGATIRDIVMDVTRVSGRDFVSPCRFIPIVRVRHIFFYLAREYAGLSFPQIGKIAGNRDHSTAMHGWKKVQAMPDFFEPELSECKLRVVKVLAERD